MNWQAISFDWNQVRAFLATAEEGSLSAAARALGQTQPTLSRQITALEDALGVTLFQRGHRSTDLTQSGIELLEHVRAMGEAASRISLTASGQASTVDGQVTITSTDTMAAVFLPKILRKLREQAPNISIEIIAASEIRDLRKREADIAIRHARPDQPDLYCKLIGETKGALYASRGFLDEWGRPKNPEDLKNYPFIGFDRNEEALPYFREMGFEIGLENFRISANRGPAIMAYVREGLGITPLTHDFASLYPELEMVLPDQLKALDVPVWLVTHQELKTSRRIRLVFDLLAEELTAILKAQTRP